MREPQDIFIKEFCQHPAWEHVWKELYTLASDMKEKLALGPLEELQANRLRLEGIYSTISHLRTKLSNQFR